MELALIMFLCVKHVHARFICEYGRKNEYRLPVLQNNLQNYTYFDYSCIKNCI